MVLTFDSRNVMKLIYSCIYKHTRTYTQTCALQPHSLSHEANKEMHGGRGGGTGVGRFFK